MDNQQSVRDPGITKDVVNAFGTAGIGCEIISACEMKHKIDEVEIGTQFGDAIVGDIKFFIVVASKENAISLRVLIGNELAKVSDKCLLGSLVSPLLSENAGMLSCYC